MIPNIQTSRYETNVSAIQHKFTISMTPTLAKLLSSQTYSDKTLAAIREPLSNAYDSHVRAGTLDTSVDLHLPTQLEPWFALRDYGTGLSHDDVIRLFFSYGVSDKRETNDEIGGLGIGAKAFFAYTDQATITSWYNKQKRIYSANKGADGLPQGMLVHIEETNKPNGIELSYPVQPKDISEFVEKTADILKYLQLKVNSNVTLTIKRPQEFFTAEIGPARVALLCNENTKGVVMGGIKYDIPSDVWYTHANKLTGNPIYLTALIYLPIGSVEISASRESLSPTEADKDLIVRILAEFQERLRSEDWDQRIADAPDWTSAVQLRQEIHGLLRDSVAYKNGQPVSMTEVLKWRDAPTWGAFVSPIPDTHVMYVARKSRRGSILKTSPYVADHSLRTPSHVYWMPTGKKVGWRNWYAANRTLDYYTSEFDLHIHAPTIEKAQEIADFIGLTKDVENGSVLKVPSAKRSAAYNPRPRGQAWLCKHAGCRQIDQLDTVDEELLIFAKTDNDLERIREIVATAWRNDVITTCPVIFKPYGLSEAISTKRYGHLPQSFKDWVDLHPKHRAEDKISRQSQMKALRAAWKSDWVRFDVIRGDEEVLRFPFELGFANADETGLLDSNVDVSDLIVQVQNWHDTHVARMPDILRNCLDRINWVSWKNALEIYNATMEQCATT